MKLEDITTQDFIMLVAVVGLVIGFIVSVINKQADTASMVGGALAGAISLRGSGNK